MQTALLASFENSKAITAIDRESIGLRADFVLKTEIRHFEAVGDGSAPPTVWVAMTARLVAMPQREIIAQASFERRVPAAANEVPAVVAAFNAAADAVIKDIVVWTVTNPALTAKAALAIVATFRSREGADGSCGQANRVAGEPVRGRADAGGGCGCRRMPSCARGSRRRYSR